MVATAAISGEISIGGSWDSTTGWETSGTTGHSSENSEGSTSSTSNTASVTCSGSAAVPPLHRMAYTVTMASDVLEQTVYTDLRLRKCSESFQDLADDDLYIYLYDVPGESRTTTGKSCKVSFEGAEYTGAGMECNEAAKQMASSFGTYAPICNPQNPKQWEPCQCSYGDTETATTCVCVDKDTGKPLEDGEIAVIDSSGPDGYSAYSHYSGWCEDHCPNSYYPGLSVAASVGAAHSESVEFIADCEGGSCLKRGPEESEPVWNEHVNWNLVNVVLFAVLIATCCIIVAVSLSVVFMIKMVYPTNGRFKYNAVAVDSECA